MYYSKRKTAGQDRFILTVATPQRNGFTRVDLVVVVASAGRGPTFLVSLLYIVVTTAV